MISRDWGSFICCFPVGKECLMWLSSLDPSWFNGRYSNASIPIYDSEASPLNLFLILQSCIICSDCIARWAKLTNIHNLFRCTSRHGQHQKVFTKSFHKFISTASVCSRLKVNCDIRKFSTNAAITEKRIRLIIPSDKEKSALIALGWFVMLFEWGCWVHLTPVGWYVQYY